MKKTAAKIALTLTALLAIIWSTWWFAAAHFIRTHINAPAPNITIVSPFQPSIEGFPGPLVITWPQVQITGPDGIIDMAALEARIWPLPGAPITAYAGDGIQIRRPDARMVDLDAASITARLPWFILPRDQWSMRVTEASLTRGTTTLDAVGDITAPFDVTQPIVGRMSARIGGYAELIKYLRDQNMMNKNAAGMTRGFMDAMSATQGTPGTIAVPVNINDNWVYLGPVRIFSLRPELEPAAGYDPQQPQTRPADSGSISPLDLNPQIESSGP